jgi:hypothetical protein
MNAGDKTRTLGQAGVGTYDYSFGIPPTMALERNNKSQFGSLASYLNGNLEIVRYSGVCVRTTRPTTRNNQNDGSISVARTIRNYCCNNEC